MIQLSLALAALLAQTPPDAAPAPASAASTATEAPAPDRHAPYLGLGLGLSFPTGGTDDGAGSALRIQLGVARSERLLLGLEGGLDSRGGRLTFIDVGATFFPWERWLFVRGALGLTFFDPPGTSPTASAIEQGPNVLLGLGCAVGRRPGFDLTVNLDAQLYLRGLGHEAMSGGSRTSLIAWVGFAWY